MTVATHSKVPLAALLPYEERRINDLYVEAICGGALMAFGSATADSQAEVPMAFQSALADILLAAELVVKRDPALNITQLDLRRPFPDTRRTHRKNRQSRSASAEMRISMRSIDPSMEREDGYPSNRGSSKNSAEFHS